MIYRTVVAPRTPHPYELALGVLCIQQVINYYLLIIINYCGCG